MMVLERFSIRTLRLERNAWSFWFMFVMRRVVAAVKFASDDAALIAGLFDCNGEHAVDLTRMADVFENNTSLGISLECECDCSCAENLLAERTGQAEINDTVKQGLIVVRTEQAGLDIQTVLGQRINGKTERKPGAMAAVSPLNNFFGNLFFTHSDYYLQLIPIVF